jgi:4-amino-4-deoxy-L-arabinose transferase-like glycosyltransferase
MNEFAVRLAPFFSFLGLLAILFLVVRRLADAEAGMLAAGMCATSVALYATAGFCMMDVPLTFCSSGALLLYLLHRNDSPQPRPLIVCGIATLLGLGMLVKGPVALAIFGLPVLADAAINRKWQHILSLRLLPGILLFLAISTPWFYKMETAQPGFLRYFFVNENIMRFLVHDYGDRYGSGRETFRGMAAIWAVVVTLPWSLFALLRPQCMRLSALRTSFPMLAAVAITAFWCLTSRVPLAYLLPVVPLFSAHLALYGTTDETCRSVAWRALPFTTVAAAVVLAATVTVVIAITPERMPGKAARPTARHNRFSYEFYNGPWGEGAPKGDAK